jgi:hypothetical protein
MTEGRRIERERGEGLTTDASFVNLRSPPLLRRVLSEQIRYNIEASALQAKILGRTLVLPSFVYLRSCDTAHETCARQSAFSSSDDIMDRLVQLTTAATFPQYIRTRLIDE